MELRLHHNSLNLKYQQNPITGALYRPLRISLLLVAAWSLSGATEAAVLPFTDAGLDFVINDDDPFAPTITFADKAFSVPTPSSATQELVVGSETIPQPFPDPPIIVDKIVSLNATIDSLSTTEVTAIGQTSGLALYNNNIFDITELAFLDPTEPILLSGSWSIEGLSETVFGDLNFSLSPEVFGPEAIATGSFPDSVILYEYEILTGAIFPTSFENMSVFARENIPVSTTVDGYGIEFLVTASYFGNTTRPTSLSLDIAGARVLSTPPVSAVPIPPALYLFGAGLIGLVGVARRNRMEI